MWSVYASDLNTPPQDNGPLRKVGSWKSLHEALSAIDDDKDDKPDMVRFVLMYEERGNG